MAKKAARLIVRLLLVAQLRLAVAAEPYYFFSYELLIVAQLRLAVAAEP